MARTNGDIKLPIQLRDKESKQTQQRTLRPHSSPSNIHPATKLTLRDYCMQESEYMARLVWSFGGHSWEVECQPVT